MGNSPAWNPDPSSLKPIAPPASSGWNPDPATTKPVQQAPPIPANATISAQPESTGWRDSLSKWADNVSNDVKYGTDLTGVGTVLKKMGAHGVYSGNPEAVGDFMASLPLGLARATKGAGEVTQSGQTWQGTKDLAGGVMQAAQIPAAFAGGPTEAGAGALTSGTSKLFGNVDRASNLFNQVSSAAKDTPLQITDEMSQAAERAQELAAAGAKGMPRVISKFISRVTDPDKPDITWNEARDFYTNVSRLSGNEYQNMAPQMGRAVAQFAGAFNDSLNAAAKTAGVGDQYQQAMQLYRTAKGWQQFGSDVWEGAKRALPVAGGAAAGSALGYGAVKKLSDLFQ
jgi:hypothetical protein